MFEDLLPPAGDLAKLSDAELIDAACGWARTENAACARKLAVMAEIFTRRTGLPAGQRELWWLDPEAAVAAELAAAQNVTRSLALHQTHRGVALRDRLPRLAELFDAGLVSEMLVRAIVWRTCLVSDEAAMAAVDTDLAREITSWGALSITKTEQAIDALVERHDPGALRRARESASTRDVQVGSPGDPPGLTSLWARLYSSDAALIDKRVQEMAYSACQHDPRSTAERRADALGALVTGSDLICQCGATDCQSAEGAGPSKNAVV
ncbi:MAG: 13E12 repeat family protein, partial [Actinomycetia bacterium]|nr:13E12 repeat family protein [Actinomycetes bacterium]